jgi:hypothetical protein
VIRETWPRAKLIAAAPALVRALLRLEWSGRWQDMSASGPACAECGTPKGQPHAKYAETFESWDFKQNRTTTVRYVEPVQACSLDAALTAANLPDQASRDEARRDIAEMGR